MPAPIVKVAVKLLAPPFREFSDEFALFKWTTDSVIAASRLRSLGVKPSGSFLYELVDGSRKRFQFTHAEFFLMGRRGVGKLLFGPEEIEARLGTTILQSAGIKVDWTTGQIEILPAIPLKRAFPEVADHWIRTGHGGRV